MQIKATSFENEVTAIGFSDSPRRLTGNFQILVGGHVFPNVVVQEGHVNSAAPRRRRLIWATYKDASWNLGEALMTALGHEITLSAEGSDERFLLNSIELRLQVQGEFPQQDAKIRGTARFRIGKNAFAVRVHEPDWQAVRRVAFVSGDLDVLKRLTNQIETADSCDIVVDDKVIGTGTNQR